MKNQTTKLHVQYDQNSLRKKSVYVYFLICKGKLMVSGAMTGDLNVADFVS